MLYTLLYHVDQQIHNKSKQVEFESMTMMTPLNNNPKSNGFWPADGVIVSVVISVIEDCMSWVVTSYQLLNALVDVSIANCTYAQAEHA